MDRHRNRFVISDTTIGIYRERFASHFGLKPEHLGARITVSDTVYYLRGIKPQNHKYPFIAETVGGKSYKFTSDTIKRAIERAGL